MTEFIAFRKIPRLNRDVIITEKIDGTNASVVIVPEDAHGCVPDGSGTRLVDAVAHVAGHYVYAGARNDYRQPGKGDNFGFAEWVQKSATELVALLGPGRHFGEWWGRGINRGYGLEGKRFSLFNVSAYGAADEVIDPRCTRGFVAGELVQPPTHVAHCACRPAQKAIDAVIGGVLIAPVPVLYRGPWFIPVGGTEIVASNVKTWAPDWALSKLRREGSFAAPGFMNPEGIVVFHEASGQLFKVTLEGDEKPKGKQ